MFFNDQYYEYIDLPIIDPMDLIYSDNWKEWRQRICGESKNPDTVNSVGSILQCTLQVVENVDGEYIELSDYTGGQNAINLTEYNNDYLNLHITSNVKRPLIKNEIPAIECKLNFNEYYDSIEEYLYETYGLKNCKVKYELVIGNQDDIYVICSSDYIDPTPIYKFYKSDINKDNFENREGWISGITIRCSIDIIDEDEDEKLYMIPD